MRKIDASQSRMSRHMAALKAAGLVVDRRDAQWVRYRRNPALADVVAMIDAVMTARCRRPKRRPHERSKLRHRAVAARTSAQWIGATLAAARALVRAVLAA